MALWQGSKIDKAYGGIINVMFRQFAEKRGGTR